MTIRPWVIPVRERDSSSRSHEGQRYWKRLDMTTLRETISARTQHRRDACATTSASTRSAENRITLLTRYESRLRSSREKCCSWLPEGTAVTQHALSTGPLTSHHALRDPKGDTLQAKKARKNLPPIVGQHRCFAFGPSPLSTVGIGGHTLRSVPNRASRAVIAGSSSR